MDGAKDKKTNGAAANGEKKVEAEEGENDDSEDDNEEGEAGGAIEGGM